jgi:phage-related protein
MDVETLTYRIEVDGADRARREMSDTSDHISGKAQAGADGIEEGSRRGVGALGKITGALGGIAGPLAGAFAVGQVVDFGKEMYGLGQELDVYDKKASTVFEGGADLVRAWADQNNEAMGLSKEKLTGLAAGFGDLLKPMGFTAEQAGKMSTEVVGLSGALSAWSGGQTSAAEVSDILAKAMLGETDGLKQLGISISQDEVNTRLARDGKDKLTGTLLAQAKATATQQLIMEKSTDAQKAWSDGSMDGIKNSNTLTATFEQLKATLAEKLMPMFQRVTSWIVAEAIPFLGRLFESGKALWNEWAPAIGDAIATIWAKAQPVFDALRAAWDFVVGLFKQGADDIGNKSSWLGETVDKLGAMFSAAFGAVQAIVSTVVDVVLGIWNKFGDIIIDTALGVWEGVKTAFGGILDMLTGVFNLIKSILTGKWGEAWDAIKQILSGAWDTVRGLLEVLWSYISGAFEAIGRIMVDLWNRAWDGVKAAFDAVWGWVTGIPGRIGSALSSMWDMVKDGFGLAYMWVRGKWDELYSWVTGLPGKISSAVSGLWDGFKNAFKSAINWIIDKWNGLSFTIPSIDIPGIGKLGGNTFSTPKIPRLAAGGIIPYRPGGTLVQVAEAGRDELVSGNTVVPLSKGWENNGLGGGPTFAPGAIVLNISNMDPAELVRLLEEWSSQNGPLPVVTIAAQAVA